MLSALVQDLQNLDDVQPVVLMAREAARGFSSLGCWDSRTEIIICDTSPLKWLLNPTRDPSAFAATLIVAPESDGVLASLLRQLQTGAWAATRSLNISWTLAEIFSDKFRTCQWLQERGFVTPETKTIDFAAVEQLLANVSSLASNDDSRAPGIDWCIVKPRDGVGSESVYRVPLSFEQFFRQPRSCGPCDPWIVQPLVSGVACSVGLIGGGSGLAAQILPAGQQEIMRDGSQLKYVGGLVPCAAELQPAAIGVAQALAAALGPFSGYLGADLVVGHDASGNSVANVIEINPRLCTSYVGYRAIATGNLAGALIQTSPPVPLHWKSSTVRFDSAGNVNLS